VAVGARPGRTDRTGLAAAAGRWIGVLVGGAALYGGVLWAILVARDSLYFPTLLLVGAAVVPAAFVTFVNEIRLPYRLSAGVVATAAVLGAVIGSIVAGQLESLALRGFGSLPAILVGLIEESSKLAIPAMFLLWRRARAADGMLLGVTVGSGFAVLETMGYGFVSLLVHQGHLAPVTRLLVARAVAAPGGHAAWTGLACAALFAIRGSRRPGWAWARFGERGCLPRHRRGQLRGADGRDLVAAPADASGRRDWGGSRQSGFGAGVPSANRFVVGVPRANDTVSR